LRVRGFGLLIAKAVVPGGLFSLRPVGETCTEPVEMNAILADRLPGKVLAIPAGQCRYEWNNIIIMKGL
jgi:hypothetical protein